MWKPRQARRLPVFSALIAGSALALAVPAVTTTASAATGAVARPHPVLQQGYGGAVKPNKLGELDCNGFSPIQHSVKLDLACADPHGSDGGRFLDHGHYIGHDEPSMRFLSSRRGSGSNFSMNETLPRDPAALPTVKTPGKDVTHWFELSIAPWISTTVCDPNSAPLLPCTPRSDKNAPRGRYLGGGQGFVELQFYPPGFAPFEDATSCDDAHWCFVSVWERPTEPGPYIRHHEPLTFTAVEEALAWYDDERANIVSAAVKGIEMGPPDVSTFAIASVPAGVRVPIRVVGTGPGELASSLTIFTAEAAALGDADDTFAFFFDPGILQ